MKWHEWNEVNAKEPMSITLRKWRGNLVNEIGRDAKQTQETQQSAVEDEVGEQNRLNGAWTTPFL